MQISIHAPTRGATESKLQQNCPTRYFNPRSHEGSDGRIFHKSARISNFNPRSHEGSDVMRTISTKATSHFNPRSHEGSDSWLFFSLEVIFYISIHAPTRGATVALRDDFIAALFQSTLPRGERHNSVVTANLIQIFQSTLPRGERHEKS